MNRQQGFTLIEVIVAFFIFAISVGAIYELFSAAGKRAAQADERGLALLTAQSLLSQQRAQSMPWPATQSGSTEAGMQWQISVAPYDAHIANNHTWTTVEVTVRVHPEHHAAREVVLRSVEWSQQQTGVSG